MASRSPEVLVVGLGAMGSAAVFNLARRGVRVFGVDRYRPPHPWGSTHGETRISRLAVGEGAEYVPLVMRSHQLWREIEEQAGVSFFNQCGGLILADQENDFLASTRASAAAFDITHQDLSPGEIRERFPVFKVTDNMQGYFEPQAGYVTPELAVQSQLDLASLAGAELRFGEQAVSWSPAGQGVEVRFSGGSIITADRLLLCAGPWLPGLAPSLAHYFAVQRQLLYWFPIESDYSAFADAPVFIWEMETPREEFSHSLGFYGFPAIDGPAGGVKLATEQANSTTTPDGRRHPATTVEVSEMYERYVKPCLPSLGSSPLRTVSCLYTATRSSRFIIAPDPDCPAALVVSACSGHGFKHSAGIGELAADWATGVKPCLDAFAWPTVLPAA